MELGGGGSGFGWRRASKGSDVLSSTRRGSGQGEAMLVSALDVVEGQGGGVILYVGEQWEADGQEVAGGECDFILTAITRNEREGAGDSSRSGRG
jgi:hypothetical protein